MKELLIIVSLLTGIAGFSQTKGSFKDERDGKIYKTVKIDKQIWMAENLNFNMDSGSVCYNDSMVYCKKYGYLYYWSAAKKACPKGWHLPKDEDWNQLTKFLGGDSIAGNKIKESGTTHWDNQGKEATNSSGFTAIASGIKMHEDYKLIGEETFFWSATPVTETTVWVRVLSYYFAEMTRQEIFNGFALSVRCVKD
jgi:uncharacterized protein (TIGR02145 family)